MKTVVLVGAGATVAAAIGSGVDDNPVPPLDATFFQLAHTLRLSGLSSVKRYMLRYHGVEIDEHSSTSMEEIFNYIFGDVHSGPIGEEADEALEALWFLIRMYNYSIARTTNSLPGDGDDGIYVLLKRLLSVDHGADLTFVTFNQDLMIEKAFASLNEKRKGNVPLFSIDKCYGIHFVRIVGVTGTKKFPEGGENSVSILKLHGSLNWEYFVRSESDPKNFLRTPKTDNITCANAEKLHLYVKYRPRSRARAGNLIPIVVPPIYEKSTLYEALLAPLRKQAEVALQEAERLIIFGYSFPEADFMARSMLRRAMYKNKSLRDLVVINTDPTICTTAVNICQADALRYTHSVPLLSFSSPLKPKMKH